MLDSLNVQAFDMFCSIGGLTYGLQIAGIQVNAGLDLDSSCRYAYEKNCNADFLDSDIKDITYSDISRYVENADYRILVGCAPCQPFSGHTAKMKSTQSDPRWNLIDEFLRIILEGKPEIVSMENVPRLLRMPIYKSFKSKLADAGYKVSDGIVSCSEFGVPQYRRRLVMLASLLDRIPLPTRTSTTTESVRQTIGNLDCIAHGQSNDSDPLHVCSRLEPINLERIQASKPGESWRDWPQRLLPHCFTKDSGQSYTNVYGRMRWDYPAPTLTTQFYRYGTGRFGHPEQDRALSLREGALLQTFPQEYQFIKPDGCVTFTAVGRHIGNAVPPALASAIGKAIVGHIDNRVKICV